jgi:tRNA threonylcarbamoyl adenosine modification protein (Sua5/YciO/YrdC/YwlC family)
VRQIDTPVYKLLKRALPGPYTFVLQGNNKLPRDFKKKKTVGIRVPDNDIIRSVVKELGNPIVSTSIYDEDELIEYTTDPELIFEKWKDRVDLVIDGGYGDNVPSTIIDVSGDDVEIIREGKGSLDIL